MTTKLAKHTPGALRAATILARLARDAARMSGAKMVGGNNLPQAQIDGFAMIIDGETNHPAMLEALEDAELAIKQELAAAGTAEDIAEHPTLKRHAEVLTKVTKAIRLARVGAQEENTK